MLRSSRLQKIAQSQAKSACRSLLIGHTGSCAVRSTRFLSRVANGPDKRHSPDLLSWLREQSRKVRRLGSVCTGALVLADADLLNGRAATTHWNWCNELIQKHPLVKVDPDTIYVRDKNVYTSAGVTAGIDLAFALVEEDLGASLALQVARMMVVFLRRSGG